MTGAAVRAAAAMVGVDPTSSSLLAAFLPWADVGVVGTLISLVAYGLFAMATGRLIPVATHERIVAARDAQLQQMTGLYESERARGDLLAQQATAGTEAARTSAAVMEALRDAVLPAGPGGGP